MTKPNSEKSVKKSSEPPIDLELCMLRDKHQLRRRLSDLSRAQSDDASTAEERARKYEAFRMRYEESCSLVARRQSTKYTLSYPDTLPVAQQVDEIKETLRAHQVIVVAGETGSGKTTQLPKVCLELGLAAKGLIGHTQPRRLAA